MEQIQSTHDAKVSDFADTVINNVNILLTTGKSYRKKIYKLGDIVKYFIDNMKIKNASLGNKYLEKMVINIETIFRNASRYSKYDTLEFINSIIKYGLVKNKR